MPVTPGTFAKEHVEVDQPYLVCSTFSYSLGYSGLPQLWQGELWVPILHSPAAVLYIHVFAIAAGGWSDLPQLMIWGLAT